MKRGALWLAILTWALGYSDARAGALRPNRGTHLFALIYKAPEVWIVPISEQSGYVVQGWHREKGTYDFIAAQVVRRSADGCKVSFTRFVMGEDYIPRTQHAEFAFPYAKQPGYRFFEATDIVGFYRNSPQDLSPEELLQRKSPNQAMQLTPSRTAFTFHDD